MKRRGGINPDASYTFAIGYQKTEYVPRRYDLQLRPHTSGSLNVTQASIGIAPITEPGAQLDCVFISAEAYRTQSRWDGRTG
jgi:hypothetical protein